MIKKLRLKELFYVISFTKPRFFSYIMGLILHSSADASIFIIFPFVMKYTIESAIKGDMELLKMGLLIIAIETVIVNILFIVASYMFYGGAYKTLRDIRKTVFRHVQDLPVSYFERNHSGDTISRMTSDLNNLEPALGYLLREIVFTVIRGVGAAIAMIILDFRVGIVLIIFGILSTLINSKLTELISNDSDKIQQKHSELAQTMNDILGGFAILKLFRNIKTKMLKNYSRHNKEVYELSISRTKKSGLLDSLNFLISWINFGGIIAVGAILVVNNLVDFGTIVALMYLLNHVNSMIKNLGGQISYLQSCLSGVVRVRQLLEQEEEKYSYNYVSNKVHNNIIQLENLTFSYNDDETTQIKDMNIAVKEGQVIALVGSSGGGKSTIIKMLLGFYVPKSGGIYINKKPINEYSLNELRELMAYVPQDAYIFDGTIEENIKYGKMDATTEEVIEAAKVANAHEFIEEMQEGYNTKVGERGTRLSGGQKQRIAIARAVLKDAPILLLDEATSALDSQSEQIVQEALNKLMEGRTVIAIAHRLSTIEHADIIYVIDNGSIVEVGKHEELLKVDGEYKNLYDIQFSS